MIRQDIDVCGYWKVIVIYNVPLGFKDVAFTHTNFKKRRSIVGISRFTSCDEFYNSIVHELEHLADNICRYYNVKRGSEKAAYLLGYLIQEMYNFFIDYIDC